MCCAASQVFRVLIETVFRPKVQLLQERRDMHIELLAIAAAAIDDRRVARMRPAAWRAVAWSIHMPLVAHASQSGVLVCPRQHPHASCRACML